MIINKIQTFTHLQLSIKVKYSRRFYPPGPYITETILHSKMLIPRSSMHQLALFKIPSTSTMLCPRIQYYFPLKIKSNKNTISTNKFIENKSLDSVISALINKPQNNNDIITKPFLDKPKILHTFSNKKYETCLTENTTINDITQEQLILELKARELIKIDTGNTAVNIKLQDNSIVVLGGTKNGIKLSGLGQAYVENFVSETKNNTTVTTNNNTLPKFSKSITRENFKIIIPPKSDDDCFIETGKQKHLLVVVDENNRIFPVCYLTSKSSATLLLTQQFKTFQDQQENLEPKITNKQQNCVKFKQLMEIDPLDIKYVKWDQEYINSFTSNVVNMLTSSFQNLVEEKGTCEFYDNKGITKEDCLKICIEHDKIAEKKGAKHPLSADQVIQNEQNKNKQKILVKNNSDVQ